MNSICLAISISILNFCGHTLKGSDATMLVAPETMNICGRDIELATTPKAAFGKLEGTDCTVHKTDDPDLFAIQRGTAVVGTVKFVNGTLARISRQWAIAIKSPEEMGRVVVNALQEMQAHGTSQCVLTEHNHASPSSEDRISVLTCGPRMLVFGLMTRSGTDEINIEEILGN